MLFDLRGRGRRRTVQVIYLGLALLFLLGFVGFGVGVGGGGGGLFNALSENSGTGSASFAGQVAKAEKQAKREPSNPQAWAKLIEAQLREASEEKYSNSVTGAYTGKGKELLNKVGQSWSTYTGLEKNPRPELAKQMAERVFGEGALNQPSQALQAWQIVIAAEPPSAALYGALASAAYKAHNTGLGELAAKKTLSLTPAADRARVKAELEAIKKSPSGSAGALPSGSTYTTTIGGKKTVLKSSANGTVTAVPTTSTSSGGASKK
jgi:hypothetical protein